MMNRFSKLSKLKKTALFLFLVLFFLCNSNFFLFTVLDEVNNVFSSITGKENVLHIKGVRYYLFKTADFFLPHSVYRAKSYQNIPLISLDFSDNDFLAFQDSLEKIIATIDSGSTPKLSQYERKIFFTYHNIKVKSDISFHGERGAHYLNQKKSFKGKFKEDTLPLPFQKWHLIIPDDRGYTDPLISNKLNQLLGLPYNSSTLVSVKINNSEQGLYLFEEKYAIPYLEKAEFPSTVIVSTERDSITKDFIDTNYNIQSIKLAIDDTSLSDEEILDIKQRILNDLTNIQGGEAPMHLDKKNTAKFLFWTFLLGKDHDVGLYNIRYGYNLSSGKFFPISRLESPIKKIDVSDRINRDLFIKNLLNDIEIQSELIDVLSRFSENKEDFFSFIKNTNNEFRDAILSDHTIHEPIRLREYHLDQVSFYIESNLSQFTQILSSFTSINESKSGDRIEIFSGRVYVTKNTFIEPGKEVVVKAGTEFIIDPGVSFISYSPIRFEGTKLQPVKVRSSDKTRPFGAFAVQGIEEENCKTEVNYVEVENGSEAFVEGVYYSGMFNVYHCKETIVTNSHIHGAKADDGMNIKGGKVTIENNLFERNFADQVDLDVVEGEVRNNKFLNSAGDSNGDGLDLSGSKVIVENNRFHKFADKGISIGENTKVVVKENSFEENTLGMAVKDLSDAYVYDNMYKNNETDITAYRKKIIFGGGHIYLGDKELRVDLDKYSTLKNMTRNELYDITAQTFLYE